MKRRVIAISGQPGSGSTTTSKILALKLNLGLFSPGGLFKDIASGKFRERHYFLLFDEICRNKGIKVPQFNSSNDSHGTLNLWKTDFGKSPKLHEAIDELQVKLAEKGNIIFDGKLSLYMIKNAEPKIWLIASLEERAKRAATRDGIIFEQALKIVEQRQNIERKEWEKIYGVDYLRQEEDADIVITTSNLIPEQVAEKIISYINNKL